MLPPRYCITTNNFSTLFLISLLSIYNIYILTEQLINLVYRDNHNSLNENKIVTPVNRWKLL